MNPDLILHNIGRHISLNADETEFFLSLLQYRKIPKKEFLLQAGEVCRTENFITKGCLRTYTIDENGNEHIVTFGVEDWWVSDFYSFLTQTPATYYIDALEDSEVWQISKDNLELLYARVPKFERLFRLLLQNAYVAQEKRINQSLSLSAEEKYLNFLARYPALEQRIAQKQISSYLGITPVFLSMLRKRRSRR